MRSSWKEGPTLQLIAAVERVEDDWGGPAVWGREEDKWLLVAARLLSILPHLASDLEIAVPQSERELSNIFKSKFHTICKHFNVAFDDSTKVKKINKCLTVQVMSALEHYSLRLNPGNNRHIIVPYTTEPQNLEARVAPSDAENWEPLVFIIQLNDRDIQKGMRKVPKAFQKSYENAVKPINLKCIFYGKEYRVKYLPTRKNFSAGWRRFVRKNSFKEDDELVFCREGHSTYQVTGPLNIPT